MTKALVAWSSGKDSAWTLHCLLRRTDVEIVGLLTTFNAAFDRVAMHAVRRELVDAQAEAAGLPLRAVPLPWPCSNSDYERIMGEVVRSAADEGIQAIAFGDLFLADIRAYRERQLTGTGIQPLFPLWEIPTDKLAREMIAGGLRARLTCIDPVLPRAFAGREFDLKLLEDLPASVDPCGENGEFHSFVYDGPMFKSPIAIESGEVVDRDGFTFADLVPVGQAVPPAR
jgi:uncharacterized protein (TIGR00290 family)